MKPFVPDSSLDPCVREHSMRVRRYAVGLACVLGIKDGPMIEAIEQAALVHDIGKMAIPRDILDKPGALTKAEFDLVKRHVDLGVGMLTGSRINPRVIPIVRSHHENWDGTGYQQGLCGRRIPIGARIVAVVDCFDALTSDRPYRPKMPIQSALQIVRSRRGTMYDPSVVDAFLWGSYDRTMAAGGEA